MRQVANLSRFNELLLEGAHFYVGHSGGKDSQAMWAHLTNLIPADRIHAVHADLGRVEHGGIKNFIRGDIGDHELLVARAVFADGSPKDFFSAVRARRAKLDADGKFDAPAFPSSASRFCTSDLKTGPIWKVIKAHAKSVGATIVVNCVGIRAEESKSRARKIDKRGTLNTNAKNSSQARQAFDWWPIAHWSIDDVWSEILDAGKRPHEAYGFDGTRATKNARLSCVFCIFGCTTDLRNGYEQRPELFREYLELERDVRGTMFHGASLADRIGIEIEVKPAQQELAL